MNFYSLSLFLFYGFVHFFRTVDASTPLFVDTRPNEGVYDLYSVVNHHGESMNSGHYTSFCRNPVDGIWRHFDDTKVSVVADESQLVTSGAYILFYEVRDNAKYGGEPSEIEYGLHGSIKPPIWSTGSLLKFSESSSRPQPTSLTGFS